MTLLKKIAMLRPHFMTAFIASLAMASTIPETDQHSRALKSLAAFVFMWATIVFYSIEHREAHVVAKIATAPKTNSFKAPRPRIPKARVLRPTY
ncbi:hypothetical protein HUU53_04370 [Candidatus Micrarchaeota archaeon]|nr:hypothetical protein [Candidatus Micrarchaeota archaeon]